MKGDSPGVRISSGTLKGRRLEVPRDARPTEGKVREALFSILSDQLDGVDLVKRLLAKGANPNARLTGRPLKRHHDAGSTLNLT